MIPIASMFRLRKEERNASERVSLWESWVLGLVFRYTALQNVMVYSFKEGSEEREERRKGQSLEEEKKGISSSLLF